MAAGTQATTEGWRWSYRTLGICNAILFLLFIVLYEETKYSTVIEGIRTGSIDETPAVDGLKDDSKSTMKAADQPETVSASNHEIDSTIPMQTWRHRLRLSSYTPEPIWPYFYRPFQVLLTFPAVLCCGLQYACGVVWLTILSNVISRVFPMPPYHFTPAQIGYMSLGPFVGNLIGSFYGGFLGDWSILFFSRRNQGYYEPEMRLYILHLPALALCGGLIMFGVTVDRVRFPSVRWTDPVLTSAGHALDPSERGGCAVRLWPGEYRRCVLDSGD